MRRWVKQRKRRKISIKSRGKLQYHDVKSPLVGVFYEAPSEGAEPYVKVGDSVKKGQVLGIVEAMRN